MSYAGILEILQFLCKRYRKEKAEEPLGEMELATTNTNEVKSKKCNRAMEVGNMLQLH